MHVLRKIPARFFRQLTQIRNMTLGFGVVDVKKMLVHFMNQCIQSLCKVGDRYKNLRDFVESGEFVLGEDYYQIRPKMQDDPSDMSKTTDPDQPEVRQEPGQHRTKTSTIGSSDITNDARAIRNSQRNSALRSTNIQVDHRSVTNIMDVFSTKKTRLHKNMTDVSHPDMIETKKDLSRALSLCPSKDNEYDQDIGSDDEIQETCNLNEFLANIYEVLYPELACQVVVDKDGNVDPMNHTINDTKIENVDAADIIRKTRSIAHGPKKQIIRSKKTTRSSGTSNHESKTLHRNTQVPVTKPRKYLARIRPFVDASFHSFRDPMLSCFPTNILPPHFHRRYSIASNSPPNRIFEILTCCHKPSKPSEKCLIPSWLFSTSATKDEEAVDWFIEVFILEGWMGDRNQPKYKARMNAREIELIGTLDIWSPAHPLVTSRSYESHLKKERINRTTPGLDQLVPARFFFQSRFRKHYTQWLSSVARVQYIQLLYDRFIPCTNPNIQCAIRPPPSNHDDNRARKPSSNSPNPTPTRKYPPQPNAQPRRSRSRSGRANQEVTSGYSDHTKRKKNSHLTEIYDTPHLLDRTFYYTGNGRKVEPKQGTKKKRKHSIDSITNHSILTNTKYTKNGPGNFMEGDIFQAYRHKSVFNKPLRETSDSDGTETLTYSSVLMDDLVQLQWNEIARRYFSNVKCGRKGSQHHFTVDQIRRFQASKSHSKYSEKNIEVCKHSVELDSLSENDISHIKAMNRSSKTLNSNQSNTEEDNTRVPKISTLDDLRYHLIAAQDMFQLHLICISDNKLFRNQDFTYSPQSCVSGSEISNLKNLPYMRSPIEQNPELFLPNLSTVFHYGEAPDLSFIYLRFPTWNNKYPDLKKNNEKVPVSVLVNASHKPDQKNTNLQFELDDVFINIIVELVYKTTFQRSKKRQLTERIISKFCNVRDPKNGNKPVAERLFVFLYRLLMCSYMGLYPSAKEVLMFEQRRVFYRKFVYDPPTKIEFSNWLLNYKDFVTYVFREHNISSLQSVPSITQIYTLLHDYHSVRNNVVHSMDMMRQYVKQIHDVSMQSIHEFFIYLETVPARKSVFYSALQLYRNNGKDYNSDWSFFSHPLKGNDNISDDLLERERFNERDFQALRLFLERQGFVFKMVHLITTGDVLYSFFQDLLSAALVQVRVMLQTIQGTSQDIGFERDCHENDNYNKWCMFKFFGMVRAFVSFVFWKFTPLRIFDCAFFMLDPTKQRTAKWSNLYKTDYAFVENLDAVYPSALMSEIHHITQYTSFSQRKTGSVHTNDSLRRKYAKETGRALRNASKNQLSVILGNVSVDDIPHSSDDEEESPVHAKGNGTFSWDESLRSKVCQLDLEWAVRTIILYHIYVRGNCTPISNKELYKEYRQCLGSCGVTGSSRLLLVPPPVFQKRDTPMPQRPSNAQKKHDQQFHKNLNDVLAHTNEGGLDNSKSLFRTLLTESIVAEQIILKHYWCPSHSINPNMHCPCLFKRIETFIADIKVQHFFYDKFNYRAPDKRIISIWADGIEGFFDNTYEEGLKCSLKPKMESVTGNMLMAADAIRSVFSDLRKVSKKYGLKTHAAKKVIHRFQMAYELYRKAKPYIQAFMHQVLHKCKDLKKIGLAWTIPVFKVNLMSILALEYAQRHATKYKNCKILERVLIGIGKSYPYDFWILRALFKTIMKLKDMNYYPLTIEITLKQLKACRRKYDIPISKPVTANYTTFFYCPLHKMLLHHISPNNGQSSKMSAKEHSTSVSDTTVAIDPFVHNDNDGKVCCAIKRSKNTTKLSNLFGMISDEVDLDLLMEPTSNVGHLLQSQLIENDQEDDYSADEDNERFQPATPNPYTFVNSPRITSGDGEVEQMDVDTLLNDHSEMLEDIHVKDKDKIKRNITHFFNMGNVNSYASNVLFPHDDHEPQEDSSGMAQFEESGGAGFMSTTVHSHVPPYPTTWPNRELYDQGFRDDADYYDDIYSKDYIKQWTLDMFCDPNSRETGRYGDHEDYDDEMHEYSSSEGAKWPGNDPEPEELQVECMDVEDDNNHHRVSYVPGCIDLSDLPDEDEIQKTMHELVQKQDGVSKYLSKLPDNFKNILDAMFVNPSIQEHRPEGSFGVHDQILRDLKKDEAALLKMEGGLMIESSNQEETCPTTFTTNSMINDAHANIYTSPDNHHCMERFLSMYRTDLYNYLDIYLLSWLNTPVSKPKQSLPPHPRPSPEDKQLYCIFSNLRASSPSVDYHQIYIDHVKSDTFLHEHVLSHLVQYSSFKINTETLFDLKNEHEHARVFKVIKHLLCEWKWGFIQKLEDRHTHIFMNNLENFTIKYEDFKCINPSEAYTEEPQPPLDLTFRLSEDQFKSVCSTKFVYKVHCKKPKKLKTTKCTNNKATPIDLLGCCFKLNNTSYVICPHCASLMELKLNKWSEIGLWCGICMEGKKELAKMRGVVWDDHLDQPYETILPSSFRGIPFQHIKHVHSRPKLKAFYQQMKETKEVRIPQYAHITQGDQQLGMTTLNKSLLTEDRDYIDVVKHKQSAFIDTTGFNELCTFCHIPERKDVSHSWFLVFDDVTKSSSNRGLKYLPFCEQHSRWYIGQSANAMRLSRILYLMGESYLAIKVDDFSRLKRIQPKGKRGKHDLYVLDPHKDTYQREMRNQGERTHENRYRLGKRKSKATPTYQWSAMQVTDITPRSRKRDTPSLPVQVFEHLHEGMQFIKDTMDDDV